MKQLPTNPDIFETQCWAYETISNPYQVLTQSFCYETITVFRKHIKWVFTAAGQPHICKKEEPGLLMCTFQVINSVLLAARQLSSQKQLRTMLLPFKKITDAAICAEPGINCYPRRKDRENPYRVFRKFFKYQNANRWKQDLNGVLRYALCTGTECGEANLLQLYLHLLRLMEAAWLVHLRVS